MFVKIGGKGNKNFIGKIINTDEIYLNKLRFEILKKLYKKSLNLTELSKELNRTPQELYYHIKYLYDKDIIEKVGNKYFLYYEYLVIPITKIEEDFQTINSLENIFYPIIKDRYFNGYLVFGSSYPHGKYKASARDNHFGAIIAYTISKLGEVKDFYNLIKLDTDIIKEKLLGENLIVIGGPVVNVVTQKINEFLDVYFDKEHSWLIKSKFTNISYSNDSTSLIAKIKNPFNERNYILLIAGIRSVGTLSGLLAIANGNIKLNEKKEFYIVLEGIDYDGDGYIDDFEIHEINFGRKIDS